MARPRSALAAVAVTLLAALALLGACSSDSPSGTSASSTVRPAASSSSGSSSSAAPAPLRILVSNDDGVAAPGIDALVQGLEALPDVTVVVYAPAENQSGSGGKTTPGGVTAAPATTASGHPATAVAGFPADAVGYGLDHETTQPQLVVTGVNQGQNIGPAVDISGTIGAARAAAARGIPGVAVSAGFAETVDYTSAVQLATDWVSQHRGALGAPTGVVNLNSPSCAPPLGLPLAEVPVDAAADLAAAIEPSHCTGGPQPATDVAAFGAGYPTYTLVPLQPAG